MTTAKICGLKTPETVAVSVAGGASHIGFALFPRSPRAVTAGEAAALAAPARGRTLIVALMVDPTDAEVAEAAQVLRPDLIQLHGRETPDRAARVRAHSGAGIIRALPVSSGADLDAAAAYEETADHLLFDAAPPKGADRPGGHGEPFDWTILAGRRFARPWFLAGGLNPGNVTQAIRTARAPLVDVSSGVEVARGLKDAALIEAFLAAVRRA